LNSGSSSSSIIVVAVVVLVLVVVVVVVVILLKRFKWQALQNRVHDNIKEVTNALTNKQLQEITNDCIQWDLHVLDTVY